MEQADGSSNVNSVIISIINADDNTTAE